jgi:hypothetical protein
MLNLWVLPPDYQTLELESNIKICPKYDKSWKTLSMNNKETYSNYKKK